MAEPPTERSKILVIDDDPVARRILDQTLRDNGYDVVFAFDAVSAVSRVRNEVPDLILLDLGLPGGGGFVVMERLRGFEQLAHIPVIVLTADGQAREQAAAAGAQGFVDKAGGMPAILAAIAEHARPR